MRFDERQRGVLLNALQQYLNQVNDLVGCHPKWQEEALITETIMARVKEERHSNLRCKKHPEVEVRVNHLGGPGFVVECSECKTIWAVEEE